MQEWIWRPFHLFGLDCSMGSNGTSVPELPTRRSVEEQQLTLNHHQPWSERQVASVNQNTSNIISSIVGEAISVDSNRVASATLPLSSGELGRTVAEIVSERNTDIESRRFESELGPQPEKEAVEGSDFVSDGLYTFRYQV